MDWGKDKKKTQAKRGAMLQKRGDGMLTRPSARSSCNLMLKKRGRKRRKDNERKKQDNESNLWKKIQPSVRKKTPRFPMRVVVLLMQEKGGGW
jgi:hypothetical protein